MRVLVIEDDSDFAELLLQQCHENGLKCLAVPEGKEGLKLAEAHLPMAIILDLNLPDINGWQVLAALKEQTATRHIPVHIISADDAGMDARRKGAVKALVKPVSMEKLEQAFLSINSSKDRRIRTLLVAECDAEQRKIIVTLVGNNDVRSEEVGSGREAIERLRHQPCDCLIMGLDFPDMSGFELLDKVKEINPDIVCVVLSGHTDVKLILKIVNERGLDRYLTKPWHREDMQATVRQCVELYDLRAEVKELRKKLA